MKSFISQRYLHCGLICIFPFLLIGQQSLNMSQLSNWDGVIQEYNDIWGYVDDADREYAIIGSYSNTHFIDISTPTAPREVQRFPGNTSSSWRDFKTYRHYAYGVSEGDGSLQIFDLSSLPNSVTKVYDSQAFFSNCHNIFIDEKHDRLYAVGASRGNLIVLDLSQNPANPTLLKNTPLQGGYVHDLYVRDHIAYCSHEYRGLSIYDFSDVNNIVTKGSITSYIDKGYNHSSWLSANGEVMAMADETHGLSVKLVDVSDLTDIEVISNFKSTLETNATPTSIAHNPFIVGDKYVVVSYYHDGVQIYDISNPAAPKKVAYYDTDTSNSDYVDYIGSWGAYPYLPSGNIIASDINNGLFVLKPAFDLHDTSCPTILEIDEAIISDGIYSATESLTAKGVVVNNTAVSFKAGSRVTLEPGFDSKYGSQLDAFIEACTEANLEETRSTVLFDEPTDLSLLASEELVAGSTTLKVTPNPFRTTTTIQIELPATKEISLHLLDGQGRLLRQLLTPQHKNAGKYRVEHDLEFLEKGIYFIRMQTDKEVLTQKVICLK